MQQDLREQYNAFSKKFSKFQFSDNNINRQMARKMISPHLKDSVILDVGCGDGTDAAYFKKLAQHVIGLDASKKLLSIAKQQHPEIQFDLAMAESMPYEDSSFDCVYSKYAIMTSPDMEPIFSEVHRVLKKGGIFVYLVVHPIRQYIEKKNLKANYFKQELVHSVLFGGAITVQEPSHTFMEYLNRGFFARFEMLDYVEAPDPTAEQINGAVYPAFMIIKAKKK